MKKFKDLYEQLSKDMQKYADFEINFSKKMIDQGAREVYGKTGKDVEKMIKYYERRLVTWNGKKWKVYFDDAGYGAIDFLLVKPNDKYGRNPVASFNPFTKKVEEL